MAIDMTSDPGYSTAMTEAAAAAEMTTGEQTGSEASASGGTVGHDADAAAIAAERKSAFAQARRHSWLVRVLKYLLPVCAVGLLGIYGLFVTVNQRAVLRPGDRIDAGMPVITRDGLAMQNPKYEGYNADGSRYFVTAKQAFPDLKQPDRVTMNAISGTLTQPDQSKIYIKAKRGIFDNKKSQLDLFERIDIASDSGLEAQLNSATVFIKGNKIVTTQPIAAQMPGGSIRANAMTILTKQRLAAFTGGVAVKLQPKPSSKSTGGTSGTQAAKPKRGDGDGALFTAGAKGPINVVARTLNVDDNKKIALFEHDLRVTQDGSTLSARQLRVEYQGSSGLPGAKPATNGAATTGGTKLKRVTALRDVVLLAANGRRATSDRAEFDVASDTAVLSGNVVLQQDAGSARAESVVLDRKADTAVLTGNVVMSQGPSRVKSDRAVLNRRAETALLTGKVKLTQARNVLIGGRLFINRKSATGRLTMPGGNKRIHATFYQSAGGSRATQSRKALKPKLSGATASITQFKSDPNAPIKIDARQLDVNDKAKSAIFKGNVIAVQGDMTIRANTLIATYSGNTSMGLGGTGLTGAGKKPAGKKRAKAKQAAKLTRIEARQKVVITSSDGQSASGDWADFDVAANTVDLGGNVVLKQGSTVILGERLRIDMTSGLARIVPRRGSTNAFIGPGGSTAKAGGGRACPPGRTCLRLIPGQLEQQIKRRNAGRLKPDWLTSTSKSAKKNASGTKRPSKKQKKTWRPTTSASEAYRGE